MYTIIYIYISTGTDSLIKKWFSNLWFVQSIYKQSILQQYWTNFDWNRLFKTKLNQSKLIKLTEKPENKKKIN